MFMRTLWRARWEAEELNGAVANVSAHVVRADLCSLLENIPCSQRLLNIEVLLREKGRMMKPQLIARKQLWELPSLAFLLGTSILASCLCFVAFWGDGTWAGTQGLVPFLLAAQPSLPPLGLGVWELLRAGRSPWCDQSAADT